MPETQWLSKPGRIETCRACEVSFDMRLGESTSSLVHRYTSWREEHVDCQLPQAIESQDDDAAEVHP